ncbi:MAG: hypothetical protein KME20_28595 [Kaiparowitsia implicata GSE-PSE-MK54-09C]|jgi:3-oxoadipate enol-lactonase|nr:hypothetical protein [Kaiparowitsia implicata GSE-PSE-MK54-09C]
MALGSDTDVLGNGLGGFVATTLAIRHGTRFDRLVLAGTGVGFTDQGRASFHVMAERVRGHGMEGVVDIAMKRLFPEAFRAANPAILAERRAGLLNQSRLFRASLRGAGGARPARPDARDRQLESGRRRRTRCGDATRDGP